jgi:ATP-dependent DNA helicase RecQ
VVDVLRGKSNERVTRWDHDKLSVFGIGADMDEAAWRGVFRQLVALGFASVDHEAHGALKLSGASREVLKGEVSVEMRRVVARKKAAPTSRAGAAVALSGDDIDLFDRLKAWRGAEARSQSVPAYVILHDSTLAEIARVRPASLDILGGIGGIGAKKLERYGAALLGLVEGN